LGQGGLAKRGWREGVRVMKWRAIAIRVLDHPTKNEILIKERKIWLSWVL
jgi:hypothetical protein